jgi:hypothetical protein
MAPTIADTQAAVQVAAPLPDAGLRHHCVWNEDEQMLRLVKLDHVVIAVSDCTSRQKAIDRPQASHRGLQVSMVA